jgi:hypothetical protein
MGRRGAASLFWCVFVGLLFVASAQGALAGTPYEDDPAPVGPAAPIASVLPQFVFGGGWYSALYFSNSTSSTVSFQVNFVSDTGTPLTVPSVGGTSAKVNLAANGTAAIEAPNAGSLSEGYAVFTLPAGVSGYGVFRQSVPGKPDQEAVVPLSSTAASSNSMTWDDTTLVTAVAMVNPSSTAATGTITLWDETGNVIGTSPINLPAKSKTAATLRSLPGLSAMVGLRGSAQFSVTTGNIAVLGLRFNGVAFTSIPTSVDPAASVTSASVLPQFAFGGGWYSALYFTNFTGVQVSLLVNFISNTGTPLTVPSIGESTVDVSISAHGTAIIEAPNTGSLVEGYAAFKLPAGVSGYGVFRQSVPGAPDQEAVVPLSSVNATVNDLTWDDTTLVTAVAMVNPSSKAAAGTITLWDENGKTIGTAPISLPPNSKTAATLRSLPGLSGVAGTLGSAEFSVTTGNIAVLGLRFKGTSFTSIPTTVPLGGVTERELAQTGLAIGQASTVLQSQFQILMAMIVNETSCTQIDGGGSVKQGAAPTLVTVYFDNACTKPYIATGPSTTLTPNGNAAVISEKATYYGLNGSVVGTMTINETAVIGNNSTSLYGLATFTPASGAQTPVQLGVYCLFSAGNTDPCAGGIAQDFPALGLAIGAVTPLTLTVNGNAVTASIPFTGGGTAVTGPLGSLTLTNPNPTSLVIQGGTDFATTTASGSAGAFELFPPTPTSWTLTDTTHDEEFEIALDNNTTRDLNITIIQVSTNETLATGTIDQSGSGTIMYSDGTTATITNWTLSD